MIDVGDTIVEAIWFKAYFYVLTVEVIWEYFEIIKITQFPLYIELQLLI